MDRRIRATIECMKTDMRNALSVAELAKMVDLSPWHFNHLFKAETSKSPMQFLNEVRIQQAKEMLTTTTLSIKEVVSALGLSDRSHFSRNFKTVVGVTPKQFVLRHRMYSKRRTTLCSKPSH